MVCSSCYYGSVSVCVRACVRMFVFVRAYVRGNRCAYVCISLKICAGVSKDNTIGVDVF